MSEKSIKVTDRRMFTADGELREEFKDLTASSAPGAAPEATAAPKAAPPTDPRLVRTPAAERPADSRPDAPSMEADAGGPGFLDLVGLLAEPATMYLREARAADPQRAAQSLELARLHIDLLALLKVKTEGNLTPQEKAMLDDVVFQLRSGYVGLRG